MSTLELEHLKHTSSSTNNLSVHSDGSLTLGMLQGNVGIGTSSPSKPLHVSLPTGSGATPRATAVAVIDGNDNTQLDILGGASSILGINFGDSSDNDQARITCNTTSGSEDMAFTVNAGVRMTIDTAGRVTTPNQPVSQIACTNSTLTTSGNRYEGNANVNIGNGWSNGSNQYTAPITGTYLVNYSGWSNYTNAYGYMVFYKNGANYYTWHFTHGGYQIHTIASGTLYMDLAQNDVITFIRAGGGTGNFSGMYFNISLFG